MAKPSAIIALLILCALLVAASFLIQSDRPKVMAPVDVGEKLVKTFSRDGVKTIDIKKGGVAVRLEKKDKNWFMPNQKKRPVNGDRVSTLLGSVTDATKEGSRASSNDSRFELDEKERTELTFESETGKTTLFVGKSPEFSKSFARTEAGGPIYEVDKGLDTDAGVRTEGEKRILDPAYFYDLKILSGSSDDIIDIAIKKGHEVVRVQKVIPGKGPVQPKQELGKDEKAVWWVTEPEGAPADESNVNSIASSFSNLNAKAYADTVPEKDRGLDKPIAKLKLGMKDGTEQTLTFGKLDGDDAIISVAGKPDPYKIYKYVYESLTKELKKKEEEKKPETAATPAPPQPDEKKAEAPKTPAITKPLEVVPAPPKVVEPEKKPALPPAVVKPPEEKKPAVEEKK